MSQPLRAFGTPQLALIVDGDRDTRELYRTFLVPRYYVVEQAADGHEALKKALIDPPDVVIMETQLSGLDGHALCEMLRCDRDTRHVSIVVVTADVRPANLERMRHAGANVVLTKPCALDELWQEMTALRRDGTDATGRGGRPRPTAVNRRGVPALLPLPGENRRRAAVLPGIAMDRARPLGKPSVGKPDRIEE